MKTFITILFTINSLLASAQDKTTNDTRAIKPIIATDTHAIKSVTALWKEKKTQ